MNEILRVNAEIDQNTVDDILEELVALEAMHKATGEAIAQARACCERWATLSNRCNVVRRLIEDNEKITVAELARSIGASTATVRRLLTSLGLKPKYVVSNIRYYDSKAVWDALEAERDNLQPPPPGRIRHSTGRRTLIERIFANSNRPSHHDEINL